MFGCVTSAKSPKTRSGFRDQTARTTKPVSFVLPSTPQHKITSNRKEAARPSLRELKVRTRPFEIRSLCQAHDVGKSRAYLSVWMGKGTMALLCFRSRSLRQNELQGSQKIQSSQQEQMQRAHTQHTNTWSSQPSLSLKSRLSKCTHALEAERLPSEGIDSRCSRNSIPPHPRNTCSEAILKTLL